MRKQWTDVAVAAKAFEELRILFFAGEVLAEITFHFIENGAGRRVNRQNRTVFIKRSLIYHEEGCGLGDGSCIEEVILTYAALDKYGCDYTPVAEDVSIQSVNHLTEEMAEKRNILIEAARIGRGRIKDIHEVDFAEYDALIIPGGIGLLNNYRDSNVIKTCVTHFISEKKPVAAMCAGIDFLRRFYGSNLLAREIEELTAEKFCFDAENNVYYTPAFRKTNSSYTTLLGIDSMIYALKQAQTLR